jgi:hypothetical protein
MVSVVSLAAALAAPFALGACAGRISPPAEPAATAPRPTLTIGFVNEAQVQVDVYLVSERRQWRLGRVAPGARTTLRLPESALSMEPGFMRLAVLADATLSTDAAHDPRAAVTIAQPVSELLAQRWTFWHPQLAAAELLGAAVRVGHR